MERVRLCKNLGEKKKKKSGRKGKDVPCREWQWQRASDGNVLNGPKQQEDMWGWRRVSEEEREEDEVQRQPASDLTGPCGPQERL